jgi:hypothetical protein
MRPTRLLPALLLLVVASNVHAVKVDTDHDSTYDFSTVKTVIWGDCTPTTDELMQKRILAAVEEQLTAKGLTIVETVPADLQIATHVSTDSHMKQSGGNVGVSVAKRTSWGSIGVGGRGNKKVHEVETGTLLIDMRDPQTGDLVWRANASDTIEDNSDKMAKKIDAAVEKAFKKFPPSGK